MGSYEHTVDVQRPVRVVYDQWTQFESYPEFMRHVESVSQTADDMTHWKVSIAGVAREYDARILEQVPDEVIAWMSVDGPEQGGRVTFSRLDAERTRVNLRLDFDPKGVTEKVGDSLGFVEGSVKECAEEFRRFVEDRVTPTGAWRGEIHDGQRVDVGGMGPGGVAGSTGMSADAGRGPTGRSGSEAGIGSSQAGPGAGAATAASGLAAGSMGAAGTGAAGTAAYGSDDDLGGDIGGVTGDLGSTGAQDDELDLRGERASADRLRDM